MAAVTVIVTKTALVAHASGCRHAIRAYDQIIPEWEVAPGETFASTMAAAIKEAKYVADGGDDGGTAVTGIDWKTRVAPCAKAAAL